MKYNTRIFIIVISLIFFLSTSCKKNETTTLAVLTTSEVTDITLNSALCGGNISSNGGSSVTDRGVCWSTDQNPTIMNNKTTDGSGTGNFSCIIEGLAASTTFYLRAYATNSDGTNYGNEINFKTNYVITPQFNLLKVVNRDIIDFIKTNDGGFLGIANYQDYSIVKFDSDLNPIWSKTYGGSNSDYVEAVINTKDGGFLIIGETNSTDGDITLNHGGYDIWICKLNSEGNLEWENCYGGSGGEGISGDNSILETSDGGFQFVGNTDSEDGDISFNHGGDDAWLVKINSTGDIEYEKTIGGSENDLGRKIIETTTNKTMLITTSSTDGDFTASGNWLVQINDNKDILWKTNLYASNSGSINTTVDNEIIAINTSFNSFLLSKLDYNGNIIMSQSIDFKDISSKQPDAVKIIQTSDNGFLIIGSLGNGNDADALLFRTSSNLSLSYSKFFSGNDFDRSSSLVSLNNNDYIYQIITKSTDLEGIQHQFGIVSAFFKLEELF